MLAVSLGLSVTGSFFIFFLKNASSYDRSKFSADLPGTIERFFVIMLAFKGGLWLLLIPAVIACKAAYLLFEFKSWFQIFLNKGPALVYKKFKFKSDLAVDLIASPAFAVVGGVLLGILIPPA